MAKKLIKDIIHSVVKHNIGALAAVIAFFGFSSLIPVVLLMVYGASELIPTTMVQKFLEGLLQSYIPALPAGREFAYSTLQRLESLRSSGFHILSIVGLLWGTVGGFVTLQQILDTIYEVRQRRSFLLQYVFGFLMLAILLALTVVASLMTIVSPTFTSMLPFTSPSSVHTITRLANFTGEGLFPVVLFATCYSCYRILPSYRLRSLPLFVGACLATVAIYVSRALFGVYTHHLGNYELMFGTLTFVMLLTFWIYVVCNILLFGAQVAVSLQRVTQPGPTSRPGT